MLREKLEEIGLTKKESKVYLELLKLGCQAVSVLSKRLNVNRTTLYSVLSALKSKGLVVSLKKSGIKYFKANDPNCLLAYLDTKLRSFDYYKSDILRFLPKFRGLRSDVSLNKPVVSYLEGTESLKSIMYESLNSKNELFSYLSFQRFFSKGLLDFLYGFRDRLLMSEGLKWRAILPDLMDFRDFFSDYFAELDVEILFVDFKNNASIFENQVFMYDSKVALMCLDEGKEGAIVIEDESASKMQRELFNKMWKFLSKKNEI